MAEGDVEAFGAGELDDDAFSQGADGGVFKARGVACLYKGLGCLEGFGPDVEDRWLSNEPEDAGGCFGGCGSDVLYGYLVVPASEEFGMAFVSEVWYLEEEDAAGAAAEGVVFGVVVEAGEDGEDVVVDFVGVAGGGEAGEGVVFGLEEVLGVVGGHPVLSLLGFSWCGGGGCGVV